MNLPKTPETTTSTTTTTTPKPIVLNSPLYRESLKALPQLKVPTMKKPETAATSILNHPPVPVSISDELSGIDNFPMNGVFAAIDADHEPTL